MNWNYFFVVTMTSISIYLIFAVLVRNESRYLTTLLYRRGDVEGYQKEVDSWKVKLLYSKKTRNMLKLDGFFVSENKEAVKKMLEIVETYKLSFFQEYVLKNKKFTFYANHGELDIARQTYMELVDFYNDLPEKLKMKFAKTFKELQYSKSILVDKDGRFAEELYDLAEKTSNEIFKGVKYIQAAQCYLYREDKENCHQALLKARDCFKDTAYVGFLDGILEEKNYQKIYEIRY